MGAAGTFWFDLRTVLRGRDFRRLFATRLVSQVADGVFQVGLATMLLFSPERATTAGGIAAAFTITVLPFTLVGPFAGLLLDRWRRRHVLVVANLVRTVLVVAVAATVAGGSVGPLLYLLALACLSVNRFFLAGLGASLPRVVPEHELVMANAVSPTCGTIAAFTGVGLGSGLRLLLGGGAVPDALVLLVAGSLYLASALLATRMAPDLLGPDPGERTTTTGQSLLALPLPREQVPCRVPGPAAGGVHGAVGDDADAAGCRQGAGQPGDGGLPPRSEVVTNGLAAAAAHVWQRRPALHALVAIGLHRFAYGITTLVTILLCRYRFADPTDPDSGLALLAIVFLAVGIGVVLAALVTPLATQKMHPATWICVCYAASALVQLLLATSLSHGALAFGAVWLGLAMQSSKICVDAIVQSEVDDAFRGRVMSFYDVTFNAAFIAAAGATAAAVQLGLVPPDGHSLTAFGLTGVLYAVTALGYLLSSRRARTRPLMARSVAPA